MISVEEAIAKFREILSGSTSWKSIINSQFVNHLAIFQSWALRDALWKIERAIQEFFIGTALNRSSIIAHAEDREYLPRKPKPATGAILVNNVGESALTILKGREFLSDLQVTYTADAMVVAPPKSTATLAVKQVKATVVTHTVTESKPFYEVLLGRELSPKVASFAVKVDRGNGFEPFTYSRLLQNAFATSKVYDEFYSHNDEIGIRFGNGTFGVVLPVGAVVRIEVQETEGDSLLLEKQTLYPVGELSDDTGQPANATLTVSSSIEGGASAESTEEIRRNLHYWPVYNEKLVWAEDYRYFLRRRVHGLIFVQAWGEEKAEEMAGAPNLSFINKIFVCAYANRAGVQAECMDALQSVALMNRKFQWVEPEHVSWTLKIDGSVLPDVIIADAVSKIKAALHTHYGKDSIDRRDTVHISEVYEVIQTTGLFEQRSGARFNIELAGKHQTDLLYQMVSIDLDKCTFNIGYV